jgi:hypothetical protein
MISADRGAVFLNPGAVCRSHITYHPSLKRYLLTMTGPGSEPRFEGSLGIYDAQESWCPWTTFFYTDAWDVGPGDSASFPSKWFSADGRTACRVFSGDDCFSIRRRATLQLVSDWQRTPDFAEARGQQLTIARFLPHYHIPGINGIRMN